LIIFLFLRYGNTFVVLGDRCIHFIFVINCIFLVNLLLWGFV